MSTSKLQLHIDAAGRLAGLIDHLYGHMELVDLLQLCAEANVLLGADTKIPVAALEVIRE